MSQLSHFQEVMESRSSIFPEELTIQAGWLEQTPNVMWSIWTQRILDFCLLFKNNSYVFII